MLRGFTVTRANLQKDGYTLVQNTMVRYVESVFPVVRSIMESRVPSPRKPEKEPDWTEEVLRIFPRVKTRLNDIKLNKDTLTS
jgi:hypothetical protein